MTIKPNSRVVAIREQIIDDPVSELSFQFEAMPDGTARLRVFGNLPFGNREFVFDQDGQEAGAGTALTGSCQPTWLREVGR